MGQEESVVIVQLLVLKFATLIPGAMDTLIFATIFFHMKCSCLKREIE